MAQLQQHKIVPCLWFDGQAEEAAKFYTSIFRNSSMGDILRWDEASSAASGQPVGSVLLVEFTLEGQQFVALNGGPNFTFNEAISFQVYCESQEEVDYYWEKLTDGGEEGQCSWCKDRYGVSWQIVPTVLMRMHKDKDAAKAGRVMQAMMQMQKIDIAAIERAYEG